jgi:hypothetical protein
MKKSKDKKVWNPTAKNWMTPKKKLKSLPNKPIPLGGGPFVGRHITG